MIRVGVVGAGFWSTLVHLPALTAIRDFDVVGVAAGHSTSAAAAARKFGLRKTYQNYEELIADPEVDIVDICAPNHLHSEITLRALSQGKDVICIKPLATSLADAEKMVDAAAKLGRKLLYAENVPFIPALRRLKSLVDDGLYGEIFRVKACQGIGKVHADWFADPTRSGGGCIIDMAVHGFAFLQWFAGDSEAIRVHTEAGTFVHPYSVEDTAVTTIRFVNGVIGQTEDSWSLSGGFDSRFEVFGTRGHALVDLLFGHPIRSALGGSSEGGGSRISYEPVDDHYIKDGHLGMFEHFRDCLLHGAKIRSGGQQGLQIMKLVDAAYRSFRSGTSAQPTACLSEV
jgi:predicted dehydrogenase